ncbi:MAG TPA: hypothetical protein VFD75_14950 [Pyrinomonadaceae bacterium]|nr:hypothetical protein [Pyrinomonadaceae bacterium]
MSDFTKGLMSGAQQAQANCEQNEVGGIAPKAPGVGKLGAERGGWHSAKGAPA